MRFVFMILLSREDGPRLPEWARWAIWGLVGIGIATAIVVQIVN